MAENPKLAWVDDVGTPEIDETETTPPILDAAAVDGEPDPDATSDDTAVTEPVPGRNGPFDVEYVDPLIYVKNTDSPELRSAAMKATALTNRSIIIREPAPVKPEPRTFHSWTPTNDDGVRSGVALGTGRNRGTVNTPGMPGIPDSNRSRVTRTKVLVTIVAALIPIVVMYLIVFVGMSVYGN